MPHANCQLAMLHMNGSNMSRVNCNNLNKHATGLNENFPQYGPNLNSFQGAAQP